MLTDKQIGFLRAGVERADEAYDKRHETACLGVMSELGMLARDYVPALLDELQALRAQVADLPRLRAIEAAAKE